MTESAVGRRFLRPPSTVSVSRKSHSFNAADRNKIKDVQLEPDASSGIPHPGISPATQSSLSSSQSEWRSRSMNAKHSFTQQGGETTPSKLAKKSEIGSVKVVVSNGRATNSPTHLVKVENPSRMAEPTAKQKLVKTKQTTRPEKIGSSLRSASTASTNSRIGSTVELPRTARPSKTDPKTKDSKLKAPASKAPATPRGKSGLVPPRAAVSRSASNSSRSSTATTASPDRKPSKLGKTKSVGKSPESESGPKTSTSVLGRLRKRGGTATTIPKESTNGITLKQAVPVKSPTEPEKPPNRPSSSASSTSFEKRRGLVPPSKLGASTYKSKISTPPAAKTKSADSNAVSKQTTGLKSSLQKGYAKKPISTQSKSKLESTKMSPATNRKASKPSLEKGAAEEKDIPKPVIEDAQKRYSGEDTPKRYSGEEGVYRRDRIDVKNLKNLLVRPYDNARTKMEDNSRTPGPVILDASEMDFSDSEMSRVSAEVDVSDEDDYEGDDPKADPAEENPVPAVDQPKQASHQAGIRNVQLPLRTDGRKPQKTATVAPFRRQIPEPTTNGKLYVKEEITEPVPENPKTDVIKGRGNISSSPATISVNKTVSVEERRKTAKGIADLRQNLEETMVSLRNSQLKNRLSDEFERRISAQLDNEVTEEIGLPEVPPPLPSSGTYRSTNTMSGLHTISHSSRSPKLHAGESLGPGSYTSPRTNKFSSLQRTQSNRSAKCVWTEMPEKKVRSKDDKDEVSSVSSEDISALVTGVSTDDMSLSSTNNSPYRIPKRSALPPKKSTLHRNKMSNSVESLEKSSNSTTESNRSLSSWKKPKSGSKSDSESKEKKKKAEKKISTKGKEKGSATVGSRLAGADRSDSPSPPDPQKFTSRSIHTYRSLPRSKKYQFTERDSMNANLPPPMQQNNQEGFVRSPALKILLRSKANKAKKSNLSETSDGGFSFNVPPPAPDTDPYSTRPEFSVNGSNEGLDNDFSPLSYHSNAEVKNNRALGYGLALSATQSLPRRFARKAGSTTWSQPRSSANSAYSLPATPDSIYDQNGLYIDNSVSYADSANSFSSLTVPEYDSFTNAMDRSFHDQRKPDWPVSGFQPSLSIAASSPNVARAAYSGRNYRTISSTHDLKRRGSSVSLGGAKSKQSELNDEVSIATARSFLQSLAQNRAVNQVHKVEEFEKSLSHLTTRLRELTTNAEEKDTELHELRNTIEKLKRQSSKSVEWDEASMSSRKLKKKPSCASLSSMSSQASVSSIGSGEEKPKKKKGWLKSSFRNAFGRSKSKTRVANGDAATSRSDSPQKCSSGQEIASMSSFDDDSCDTEVVRRLKEELRQKERKLTDIRLEALTSRHQLQHLQDTMNQMKSEMESLRKENEQLHQLGLSAYSLTSSPTFLHSKSNGATESAVKTASEDLRIKVVVEISNFTGNNSQSQEVFINQCPISRSITWDQLDQKLSKIFMAYCQTVDPSNCMRLSKASIDVYSIGEGVREIGMESPDLLPCGYLVGDNDIMKIKLQNGRQNCVDALAFELLIDKTIVEKYVDLILDQRRVIICGPIGTGKTLLASRLAGYIAEAADSVEPVIYVDAKLKALSELQDFLQNVAVSTRHNKDGYTVIVLDNLQNVKHPQKLLRPFSQTTPLKGIFLICVTNQKASSGLQEFCWITCNNNSPPVQTFLARKLRRAYLEHQISQGHKPDDVLSLVIAWLPKCWQHINDFLEMHSGPEVAIGPRMFSSCPMDAASARVWFTDLWNFSVVPYVISAVKRSTTRKNNTLHWSDPTDWVLETMPWRNHASNLLHIRAEDIGPSPTEIDYPSKALSQSSGMASQSNNLSQSSSDPLYNMLMRLQEAANYDSDANSSHDENFELSIDKALTELGS